MVYNTEKWKTDVNRYVDEVKIAFSKWSKEMQAIAGDLGVGGSLEDLKESVADVTDESDKLIDTLVKDGGVLDTIQAEIDAVDDLVDAYARQRQDIQKNIEKYEELIDKIKEKKRLEA
jgi:uncharacterized protein Yka (UPF0111/DUF47 family)